MSTFRCNVCGAEFGNEKGLQVHYARKHGPNALGKKKRKYTKRTDLKPATPKQGAQITRDTVTLDVPCNLAGTDFNVSVTLSIKGTAIYPA